MAFLSALAATVQSFWIPSVCSKNLTREATHMKTVGNRSRQAFGDKPGRYCSSYFSFWGKKNGGFDSLSLKSPSRGETLFSEGYFSFTAPFVLSQILGLVRLCVSKGRGHPVSSRVQAPDDYRGRTSRHHPVPQRG